MNDNGGTFRKKRVYFSQVSNIALRDNNLSLKSKGLYSLIQSYITIEDFTLYKNTLMKQCKEKRDGFNTAWKELKDNGYLIQYKTKLEDGTYNYEYELLDEPGTDYPHTEKPHTDKPHTVKPHLYNNTNSNNTNFNNTNSYSKGEKKLKFNNFEGREYDYKELEKKLLGWDKEEN